MASSRNQSNVDLAQSNTGFTPKFDTGREILMNENSQPIQGTGILIFQGFTAVSGVSRKDGKPYTFNSVVFSVMDEEGEFKNVSTALNSTTLSLTFKALGLELPYISNASVVSKVKSLQKSFGEAKKLDTKKALEMIQEFRGLAYYGQLKKIEKNDGLKIFQIQLNTLAPVLEEGETVRVQPIEDTDPDSDYAYVDESGIE